MNNWKVLKIGVGPWLKPKFAKRIELSNFVSMLFGFFVFGFAVLFYYYGLFYLTALSLLWFSFTLFCLFLNHIQSYSLSRIGLMIGADLFGTLVCWTLGKETGFHLAFFAGICTPLIIFEPSEKIAMFLSVVLTVSCYLFLQWLPESLSNPNSIKIENITPLRLTTDVAIITVILLSIYYLRKINEETESELEATVKKLENTNQMLELSTRQTKETFSRLIQSEKMAALGVMAGGIGHEINNPLTAIVLNAEAIKKIGGQMDSPIFQRGQTIIDVTKRIAKIIQSLKKYCRDSVADEPEVFKIRDVIHDTLALCTEKFSKLGIEVFVKEECLDTSVNGQIVPLSQTLLNLLNNSHDAVKSLKEKWIHIEANVSDQYVHISVIDSGTGIPEEVSDKIFRPFFTTKNIGEGTGLGLSISQGIIRSHGGTLQYDDNSPNTKFVISLPIGRPDSGVNPGNQTFENVLS